MSFSDRYTRVFFQSSASNLASARRKRLRLAEVRQQLATRRTAAEAAEAADPVEVSDTPDADGPNLGVKLPLFITTDMRQQLADLGYLSDDIKKMTPEVAHQLIDGGVTKKKQEQAAARREKLFDDMEEKVLNDLNALKKRLDVAKQRLEKAHAQVERLDASLADVEEQRDAAEDPHEQERLRKKSDWIQVHITRSEKSEEVIRREIEALDKLVSAITKTEDGLIEELQEANDAALITPGTEDDHIIEDLMKSKLKELEEISKLRQTLSGVQKTLDKKMERLLRVQKDIAQLVEIGGSHYDTNTLREVADSLQSEVDDAEKAQRKIVKDILRHEDRLRDVQTERRLQELDEALKDLPAEAKNIEKVREKAKEQIQQEDLGREIASKPQKYKKRSEEMLAFTEQVSQHYGDFIISFLAPDIPSDPKIESFIRTANTAILKRAQEAKKLAAPYSRNHMQRSAVLLVPSLYEFLASTMNGVVGQETKQAMMNYYEARALHTAFVEAGMVKEALDLQQVLDTSKAVGQGVGDAARWTREKGKQLGKSVSDLVEQGKEALDRRKFQKEDTGARRDPALELKKQQRALRELVEIEDGLKQQIEQAQQAQQKLHDNGGTQEELHDVRNTIIKLQEQLKSVGERKDVISHGLEHKPESGILKSQEQAARRPKTDYEQAVRLLTSGMPKLIDFVREGIPDDEKLETELLRQSDRIAEAARRMIQESFKAKAKYPNLPPTIQAYGHMFLAIDDALHKALRSGDAQAA